MLGFLRRLWVFARPYQTRLILGLACGVLFALANAALVIVIKFVFNDVFPGAAQVPVAEQLKKIPGFLRPIAESLMHWLPEIKSPSSKLGIFLVISSVPAVMLVRGLFGYLNIYLMNWASIRTVADLRMKLFDHLQNLSLGFFSLARTGDLISRVTNDTLVLHAIIANTVTSMIKAPVTVLCLLTVRFL